MWAPTNAKAAKITGATTAGATDAAWLSGGGAGAMAWALTLTAKEQATTTATRAKFFTDLIVEAILQWSATLFRNLERWFTVFSSQAQRTVFVSDKNGGLWGQCGAAIRDVGGVGELKAWEATIDETNILQSEEVGARL